MTSEKGTLSNELGSGPSILKSGTNGYFAIRINKVGENSNRMFVKITMDEFCVDLVNSVWHTDTDKTECLFLVRGDADQVNAVVAKRRCMIVDVWPVVIHTCTMCDRTLDYVPEDWETSPRCAYCLVSPAK